MKELKKEIMDLQKEFINKSNTRAEIIVDEINALLEELKEYGIKFTVNGYGEESEEIPSIEFYSDDRTININ